MRRLVLILVLFAAAAAPVAGQVAFGPQGSWGDDTDFGIGARVQVPFANFIRARPGTPVTTMFLIGSFDWFFPDEDTFGPDFDYFEINANAAYPIEVEGLLPYVGAGLNFARQSNEVAGETQSDTEVGLNLLGGLNFLVLGQLAFTEARFELGGGEQFVLSVGLLFGGR